MVDQPIDCGCVKCNNIEYKDIIPYEDLISSWAEYEYNVQVIKNGINNILDADEEKWCQNGIKDEFYHSVDIINGDVVILVKPMISISAVELISSLLGIDGQIISHGTKKNKNIKIVFSTKKKEGDE